MPDRELTYKIKYEEVNLSQVQKNAQSIAQARSQSLNSSASGGNSPQASIDKHLTQLSKVQDKIKLLDESYSKAFSQPHQERNLAKITSELSSQYGHLSNMSKTSDDYLKNLQRRVELQKQSTQLTNQANKNEGTYSAHSDRQFAALQQMAGKVPGGNILNKFIGGMSRGGAAGGAESGLMGGGGGSALAGGAMAAAAGAAALAIGALVSKEMELAARSNELAQSAATATSSLGQLRSQLERTSISKDAAASSPNAVSVAGIQSWLGEQGNNFMTNLFNNPKDRATGISEKISAGLGGDDKENWRRTLEQRQDMEVDLSRTRKATDEQFRRSDRDYNIEKQKFQIDTANQLFDLSKQSQREETDYRLAKEQYDTNFQGKMAAKQFQLQKDYAQADYQLNVQRQTQDYQISKARQAQDLQISLSDKSYDFGVSRQRATQDYTLNRQDKAYDFSVSQGRNQEQFDVSRERSATGRKNQLFDMAMGGANGLQYLQAARDYSLSEQYAKEDFQRQKKYSTQDYKVGEARDARGFLIGQDRNQADFNLSNQRDIRGFNIAQGREGEDFSKAMGRGAQDFSIANQRMDTARQLDIETELYNRKYQGSQLEMQHNRNLEDEATAMQRFLVNTGFQQQGLANRGSDMAYDKQIAYQNLSIDEQRARRNQGYVEQDFAGSVRKSDPLAAYGQSLTDPAFAKALADNQKATGQRSLADQVKDTLSQSSPGGFLGDLTRTIAPWLGLAPLGTKNENPTDGMSAKFDQPGAAGGNKVFDMYGPMMTPYASPQQQQAPVINLGNRTFQMPALPAGSGFDQQAFQNQIEKIVNEGDKQVMENIMNVLMRTYSGI